MEHAAGFNCVCNNRTRVLSRILHRIGENIPGYYLCYKMAHIKLL